MSFKKVVWSLGAIAFLIQGIVRAESDLSVGFEMQAGISAGGSNHDCPDCERACLQQQQDAAQPNAWVEAAGLLAGPLAMLGSTWVNSYYGYKSQKAWANTSSNWADAYKSGNEACTNNFNSYLSYLNDRGANPLSSTDASSMMTGCNLNSSMNGYAGYAGLYGNGYGGVSNPWLSSGYSSGMMSGLMGPYYSGSLYSGMGTGGIGISGTLGGWGINATGSGLGGGLGVYFGSGGNLGYGMGSTYPSISGTGGYGNSSYGGNIGVGLGVGTYGGGTSVGGIGYGSLGIGGWSPTSGGAGSYWGNSGGWGNTNGTFNSQYINYVSQQQAAYQQAQAGYSRMQGNMAMDQGISNNLYQNYLSAGQDYYRNTGSSSYGSYYGGIGNYPSSGGSYYGTGNLGAQFGISIGGYAGLY